MFRSSREKQNLREVAKSSYIFLTTHEVEKYVQLNSSNNCIHHYNVLNICDPELQLINTKIMIKNKLTGLVKWVEKI